MAAFPRLVALDLEGTLVSNAMSLFPRPCLYEFLDFCHASFSEVVLFTAVRTQRARRCLETLVEAGDAPSWVAKMPIVHWQGARKDLRFVREQFPSYKIGEMLLVEDLEDYVEPQQRGLWVAICPWVSPYPSDDRELLRIQDLLACTLVREG
ncbi:MAG: hypothetical protein H6728_11890 [Myxococcales bacterium]|nr:hypothetical protein [Myxococcales bacterium]